MSYEFKLLTDKYLEQYKSKLYTGWDYELEKRTMEYTRRVCWGPYHRHSISFKNMNYYFQQAAVFSSRIEGNGLDIVTYLKWSQYYKEGTGGGLFKPDHEMKEIDDLIAAYDFACAKSLTKQNFLKAHGLMSKTFIKEKINRGKLRTTNVVIAKGSKVIYIPCKSGEVQEEFDKLFEDINHLLNADLSVVEIFYYAAMIHLIFEAIHPFVDGNGRAGRLLEKWFIDRNYIAGAAWGIPSEEYYWQTRVFYYLNLNKAQGAYYADRNMDNCLDFLLMLPEAFKPF